MIHKLITCMLFLFSTFCSGQHLTATKTVNIVGRQKVLVYSLARNYMAVGGRVRTDDAIKYLDKISAIFNENQKRLMEYSSSKDAEAAIAITNNIWSNYRMLLFDKPHVINAESIISESKKLIEALIEVENIIKADNPEIKISKFYLICSKQRLLSQKMGMLYLANLWGVRYKSVEKEIKETLALLESNLYTLFSIKCDSKAVYDALIVQREDLAFINNIITSGVFKGATIYSNSNLMAKQYDIISDLYASLNLQS